MTGASSAAPIGFDQFKAGWRASEALLLDRHGVPLQEIRQDARGRRTAWVALGDVSPALISAILHAEDRRFRSHGGVDWLAAGEAAMTNWLRDRPRGASTLTMQLAALLDPGLRASSGRRDLDEKWRQMRAARELEKSWSKDQILEAYLNLLPLRGELTGIDAASRGLFDMRPAGLGPAESLILAALIRAPNAPPNDVARRVCALAKDLPNGPDCETLKRKTLNTLAGRYPILPTVNLAPHLAERFALQPGQRLVTSLDAGLQAFVLDTLSGQLERLAARHAADTAALVADNTTGEVLAYVSMSGRNSTSPHTDGVMAPRQAGSTLKPFLYGLALERRLLTAASPLEDTPLALTTPGGQYAPRNYDERFHGLTSLRLALAGSINIPAVKTAELVGLEALATRLAELGFTLDETGEWYGPALALGSLDVRLWELANAYRTLANGGRPSPLVLAPGQAVPAKARVMSPAASFIIADILADRQARAATFGLENPLASRFWSAVKTGTSKDMRDNWCVGFSDRYTVGVWVGNFDGAPMHDVSGMSGAAPAWAAIMKYLHARQPSHPPKPPKGLTRASVQPPGEPLREEWFLAGTAPHGPSLATAHPPARILRPAQGAILALDPDQPRERQRLTPRARDAPPGARWTLDQHPLDGDEWPLQPGPHTLVLQDAQGVVLDQADFSVR